MHVFPSKYMSLKIEILNIPLLASCHVFDISEEVHSYIMNLGNHLALETLLLISIQSIIDYYLFIEFATIQKKLH